jgi:hypothetical protein
MLTTHRILSEYFVAGVVVDDGICVQAAPIIGYCVGRDSRWFFDYCKRKGWTVEPIVEDSEKERTTFVFHGITYELSWAGNRVVRIIARQGEDEEEITWQELPAQLKWLL